MAKRKTEPAIGKSLIRLKAEKLSKKESSEFGRLNKEQQTKLQIIRKAIALDFLDIPDMDICNLLRMPISAFKQLIEDEANSSLWELAENDFGRRVHTFVGEMDSSLSSLLTMGEQCALYKLYQVFLNNELALKVPGHPSLALDPIGKASITNVIAAASAFLKASGEIYQRIVDKVGYENAEKMGLNAVDDQYARKVKEHHEKVHANKLVKKQRKAVAERKKNYDSRQK